jgi:hypothetical protein
LPPKAGDAGTSGDGANGAGVGFGARFLAFAFFAGFAFFIPFFLRAGPTCFAFLGFFAFAFAFRFFTMISLPIGSTKTLYINSTSRTRK